MKKLILIAFTACLLAPFAQAQTEESSAEFNIHQELFGTNKKLILESFIAHETDQEKAFWTLFDEYETQRLALAEEHFNLVKKYIASYNDLDDESTLALWKEAQAVDKSYRKLMDKYFKKVKKESGVKIAVQFRQSENYFRNRIRADIFEEIPFLGEFKELKEEN